MQQTHLQNGGYIIEKKVLGICKQCNASQTDLARTPNFQHNVSKTKSTFALMMKLKREVRARYVLEAQRVVQQSKKGCKRLGCDRQGSLVVVTSWDKLHHA